VANRFYTDTERMRSSLPSCPTLCNNHAPSFGNAVPDLRSDSSPLGDDAVLGYSRSGVKEKFQLKPRP